MSKIDELIIEKCSEGVEFYKLDEICVIQNGYTPSKKVPEYWENGDVPWFRMEDIRTNGKVLNYALQNVHHSGVKGEVFPANSIIFSTTATIGEHALITVPFLCNQQLTHIHIKENQMHKIDIKYLFYCSDIIDDLCRQNVKGGGTLPAVSLEKFRAFEIPVPPIEVQQEIVRILDKFTELEAELQAELEARKRQFSYVSDKLLLLENSEAPQVSIKEICNDVFSGKNKERLEDGKYPVYGSTGIISSTNTAVYNKKQILIARVGANAGYVHIADGQYDVSDNTLIADVKDGISLMYIYYQMVYMNLHKYAKGGGQPLVTAGQIKNLTIPLPSLCEQERIVSILQKFDTICNDEHSGIPAEIATRRRQYEFYRDSLLTFDRIGENV